MKEIRMDYAEYESMVETIKTQQEFINKFKEDSRVVLIDDRQPYNIRLRWIHGRVPIIICSDEMKAKEYLQKEFDTLAKEYIELNSSICKKHREEEKHNRKKWWL